MWLKRHSTFLLSRGPKIQIPVLPCKKPIATVINMLNIGFSLLLLEAGEKTYIKEYNLLKDPYETRKMHY
jgi:hypothetical protein